jgi:thiamine-phosphate pyrophosphorylase
MPFTVVVITPEQTSPKETEVISGLFKAGLKTLHVRKPLAGIQELKSYLQHIPENFLKRIVVHSHYTLAKEFNLKGIHLTEKAKKLKVKSYNVKVVSASFHSTKDILKSRRKYEYVFLGPVFDSISKKNYKSNFTSEELSIFLKRTKQHVTALGGINNKNIKTIKQLNFSGAAVLGYIWEAPDPVVAFKKLLSETRKPAF